MAKKNIKKNVKNEINKIKINSDKINSDYVFNSFISIDSTIIGLLPFIGLLLIGLIYGNITYHQKVFKTFIIFLVDCFLLVTLFINSFSSNRLKKDKRYLLYFIIYLIYVSIQFVVSFFAKESPYDVHYHYSNYLLLISYATFIYLFVDDIDTIKFSSILFSIFFIILFVWSNREIETLIKTNKSLSTYRPSFSFGNTDYFSCYMIGILPLSLILPFAFDKNGSFKSFIKHPFSIVSFILALLGLIPVFLSQTRASWIGLFFSIILIGIPSLIIMQNRLKNSHKFIIIISFIVIMFTLPIGLLNSNIPIFKKLAPRIVESIKNPMFSMNDRINGWSGGLGLFKKHPILGGGLGTVYAASFKYMNKYFYIYSDSNSFKHSHCEYVEVLGEGGIVGITLFIGLLFFVLISLFRIVYSKKYRFDIRLISLGVALGLISMMIHQIFSLAFRMSVTMSAYFFIIGISIVIISISKKYIIDFTSKEENIKDNIKLNEKNVNNNFFISKNLFYIIIGFILILITSSFFLFRPVFRAENNMVKGEYQKANEKMPTYIYSLSSLYTSLIRENDKLLEESIKNNFDKKYESNIISYFNMAESVTNRLNTIIPNYQTIGVKYSEIYYKKYIYFLYSYNRTMDTKYWLYTRELLTKMLQSTEKTLNTNFLYFNDYGLRLYLLRNIGNKELFRSTLQDLITARIYLDICRGRRIVKENVIISFENGGSSNITETQKNGQTYFDFIINLDEELEEYNNNSLMDLTFSLIDNDISIYYGSMGNIVYDTILKRLYEN